MRLRLMKILLFIPCAILDGLFLGVIALPLWIVGNINPLYKEPLVQWLAELKKGGNNEC